MVVILGPSKTIDTRPHGITGQYTMPNFLSEAELLIEQLQKKSPEELKTLLKVSDKLAELNFKRYAFWNHKFTHSEGSHALLSFAGEVFNGLSARTLKEDDLLFAQKHVRLLSGLYGILRPLDIILPYRLEMGTRMANSRGANLYEFWREIIPAEIRRLTSECKVKVLINLASNEYFSAISPRNFPFRIVTPVFKEHDGNSFRNVTIYAKKARGMMLRFILENRITNPDDIKAFDKERYYFNAEKSDDNTWWFCR